MLQLIRLKSQTVCNYYLFYLLNFTHLSSDAIQLLHATAYQLSQERKNKTASRFRVKNEKITVYAYMQ